MKNKRNLNTKWLLLQNDQNADTTLLHSHDDLSLNCEIFSEQKILHVMSVCLVTVRKGELHTVKILYPCTRLKLIWIPRLLHVSSFLQKAKQNKQDMTVPFARAQAKLGGSIR